jgi:hypothetical protein
MNGGEGKAETEGRREGESSAECDFGDHVVFKRWSNVRMEYACCPEILE